MLLDTGNNFASGTDHARCCLQSHNSIFKMLKKLNFKFYDKNYCMNNFLWEGGSKLVLEDNLYSMSRSTKKASGVDHVRRCLQVQILKLKFLKKIYF